MIALPKLAGTLLWKIGTGAVVIAMVVLMALLMASYKETKDITKQRNELTRRINDPVTGYLAQLSQARTNSAQLKTQFERQIVVMRTEAEKNQRALESTRKQLDAANRRAADLEKRAQRIMAVPPKGETLEDRVLDVDRRVMEDLNRG